MKFTHVNGLVCVAATLLGAGFAPVASAQTINHQITLPSGDSWCADSMINGLFADVNSYRAKQGKPALAMSSIGMKDAEIRATQVAAYMASTTPNSPGWNPHQGYDTTAASLGYNLVSENLAWATSDPSYIVNYVWQDSLHIAAMLSTAANVMGVSCVYSNGWPYWTYEPGIGSASTAPPPSPTPNPNPNPNPNPTPAPTALDSEESAFLTLLNNYRAQNGIGPLQVSVSLEAASQWMSKDMASNNYLSHTDSVGRSTQTRLAAFGYPYSPWAENLLGGDTDAQTAFNDWISACDPDVSGNCTYAHRRNMLSGGFVVIGIARAYNASSSYGWYWATDFGGYMDQVMPPPPNSSKPVISSFVSSPGTITAGQTATLSWSVSGATSVSIDNGVGTVSGATSIRVTPTGTTTYHLTASSSAGTATASAVVTVTQPVSSSQPPPTLLSATAKSSTDVVLQWTASTDSKGILGYDVIRNGVVTAQVPGSSLTYSDTSVIAGTAYNYAVQAFDGSDNLSNVSNVLSVTPPVASGPTPGVCPGPGTAVFTGCYYNDVLWAGAPAMVRTDNQIKFDWTKAPPSPAVSASGFSVTWQGNFNFAAGDYVFTMNGTGGMYLYVDGGLEVISPQIQNQTVYAGVALTAGQHLITLKYFNSIGGATATLSWAQSSN